MTAVCPEDDCPDRVVALLERVEVEADTNRRDERTQLLIAGIYVPGTRYHTCWCM